ncbi:hypothetical protein ACFXHA_42650 [Nocardia sp. NPDC059240]|uniref:hypothetical protein n=1 Tax=Nocardia sp. NPDC059240 TaxID=3346786 RepID=UPI0036CCF904
MHFKKFLATAAFTAAATAIATAPAQADAPAPTATPVSITGTDHGVAFTVSQVADSNEVTVDLDGGHFTATGTGIEVTDATGTRIGEIPFSLTTSQGTIALAAEVGRTDTHLSAQPIDGWVSQRQVNQQIGAAIGGAVGFAIGAFAGLLGLVGMGVLAIITVPVGMLAGLLIGGGIGFAIGTSVPASDVPDMWEYHCGSGPHLPTC